MQNLTQLNGLKQKGREPMLGTTCDPVTAESRGQCTMGRPVSLHKKSWSQKKRKKQQQKENSFQVIESKSSKIDFRHNNISNTIIILMSFFVSLSTLLEY